MNKVQRKKIADNFFRPVVGKENTWTCIYCPPNGELRQVRGSGNSNLVNHALRKHAELCRSFTVDNTQRTLQLSTAVSSKAKNLYSWLDWIVTNDLPFSTVEKQTFRKYSNLAPISTKTLMKYLQLTVQKVTASLTTLLPDRIGVVFDGWSDGSSTHSTPLSAAR